MIIRRHRRTRPGVARCPFAPLLLLLLAACTPLGRPQAPTTDSRDLLRGASRRTSNGWTVLHLEGAPERVGFQHGYLLADEIDRFVSLLKQELPRETHRPWAFYRETAQRLFWPRIPGDLRAELRAIADGARARGVQLDEWDLVAENAFLEIAWYYIPSLARTMGQARRAHGEPPGMCSAFVATGAWTAGGQIVMGHNAWVSYPIGRFWTVLIDLAPTQGHRFVMDALPGFIHSGDDFYVSDAGLMVTETTITQFHGFDPLGVPELVRARRAVQLADDLDHWIELQSRDSNGAYANDWLVGDRKTGEIAQLENGLRNQRVWRTRSGYFIGSNFPSDPRVIAEETSYRARPDSSMEARRRRWEQLVAQFKGRIDVAAAKRFLADHYDVVSGRPEPSIRTLCGHGEADPAPRPEWGEPPFWPSGAVTSKTTDSQLAASLSLWASAGHACGTPFLAAPFLAAHPEHRALAPVLADMMSSPWALFTPPAVPASAP